MKKILVFFGVFATASSVFAGDIRVNGIVCEGKESVYGVTPTVIIKDISNSRATLILNLNGTLPDIRTAVLDKVRENGKVLVGYISEKSSVISSLPNFAVYTNGSTPQDTTEANLSLEGRDLEIEMTCFDGMSL